jgi:hypothetical protein
LNRRNGGLPLFEVGADSVVRTCQQTELSRCPQTSALSHFMGFHSRAGIPASEERRAKQRQEMLEELRRQHEDQLAEAERSRLAEIERQKRFEVYFESLGLDDIIEIPCIENGVKVMRRFHERGGKLSSVDES